MQADRMGEIGLKREKGILGASECVCVCVYYRLLSV